MICPRHILTLLLLLLTALPLSAQTRMWSGAANRGGAKSSWADKRLSSTGLRTDQYDGVHHLVGLHLDGAWSAFVNNVPDLQMMPAGWSAGLGLDYSYHNGILLVQTGVALAWQDVGNAYENQVVTYNDLTDSQGTPFRLRYYMDNRTDYARTLYLQVPLLLGSYFYNCYFLIGPKLNLSLLGNTQTDLLVSTTADYARWIGEWEEMDNHGLRKDVALTRNHERLQLGIDILASAELGFEWAFSNFGKRGYRRGNEHDQRLRIGLFADFGILNICPSTSRDLYSFPDATRYDFATFDFNHTLATPVASGWQVHNVFAGLRLSYFFFGYQSKEKCLICGPWGAQSRW